MVAKLECVEGGYIDGRIDDPLCLNAQTAAAGDDLKIPQVPIKPEAVTSEIMQ